MLLENSSSEIVCIHFPEGAYAVERGSKPLFAPSYDLPPGFIKGTAGAGDAFCAGMLYGIHEEWELQRSMQFANAMAAICLTDPSTSGGMTNFKETIKFMNEMPVRKMSID